MWPEFVESFNQNLNITFDLRDETQAGLPAMRFRRDAKGKRINSRSRNIDPMGGGISEFSPQSEEEEEEIVAAHLQGNGFRTFLAPSSFEYEDESELDPYVYPKNGKRSGVLELSPAKAGMDVTPACYDFPKRKTGKNKRSATMHSLASALSNVTNLALGAARHHHSSPLRTRASTESDHQQQINRTNRVMASVDEEERTTAGNALTQSAMQSLEGAANLGRTGRTGSGTLSAAGIPYSATAIHPTTRAERSSAALYATILNRVDHIQNQMNNYENMLLQKMDGLTRLLQLTLPENIMINGKLTKVEDLLLEPLTIPVNGVLNGGNQSKLQTPIISSSLTQQSASSRMCKSYTDLVSSLKRGSTITLEEHPKSEHSDPAGRSTFTATHSSPQQQPSTTRPTLQQQRISLKHPFRNAHSMFESYDHNNNAACQSTLQTQLSTTTAPTNLATTSTIQAPSSTHYLTTSTNFNLGHSLASLELSDIDLDELDEVNVQTGELQLLIHQPVTVQPETTSATSTVTTSHAVPSQLSTNQSASTTAPSATLRPRSPFDQVTLSSSYSNRPLFQRAASSSITTTDQPLASGGQELRLSRSSSSNLVAHETAISRLGNTTLTSVTTGAPLSSTQSSTSPNASGSTNQTQRKDNKNLDNV